MKKAVVFLIFFSIFITSQVYGQHKVNDIKRLNGWYKINVEIVSDGNGRFNVTQCYPNGDEFKLNDDERKQLPLWVKIFCLAMYDEILKAQMEELTFNENGILMKFIGFTLTIDSSKSEEEILELFGQDMVNKYRNKNW